MDQQNRKELQRAYREREETGGVYRIKNTANGKVLLLSTTNMAGSKNQFQFSLQTDSCFKPTLRNDWKIHGKDAFVFEVLEELTKKQQQTPKEFNDDINMLEEMWRDTFQPDVLY